MKKWQNNFNKGALKVSNQPTELEKLQQEYNNKAFLLGNCVYKQELLVAEQNQLKASMSELSVKAAEVMKKEKDAAEKPEENMHILPIEEPKQDKMAAPV